MLAGAGFMEGSVACWGGVDCFGGVGSLSGLGTGRHSELHSQIGDMLCSTAYTLHFILFGKGCIKHNFFCYLTHIYLPGESERGDYLILVLC